MLKVLVVSSIHYKVIYNTLGVMCQSTRLQGEVSWCAEDNILATSCTQKCQEIDRAKLDLSVIHNGSGRKVPYLFE